MVVQKHDVYIGQIFELIGLGGSKQARGQYRDTIFGLFK